MEVTTATTAVLDAVCQYLRNEIDLEALEDSAAQYIHLPASLPANTTVVQLLGAIELSPFNPSAEPRSQGCNEVA